MKAKQMVCRQQVENAAVKSPAVEPVRVQSPTPGVRRDAGVMGAGGGKMVPGVTTKPASSRDDIDWKEVGRIIDLEVNRAFTYHKRLPLGWTPESIVACVRVQFVKRVINYEGEMPYPSEAVIRSICEDLFSRVKDLVRGDIMWARGMVRGIGRGSNKAPTKKHRGKHKQASVKKGKASKASKKNGDRVTH